MFTTISSFASPKPTTCAVPLKDFRRIPDKAQGYHHRTHQVRIAGAAHSLFRLFQVDNEIGKIQTFKFSDAARQFLHAQGEHESTPIVHSSIVRLPLQTGRSASCLWSSRQS
jgi:hypothetical protein